MSGCSCDDDTARVRVSDEGLARRDGRNMARLRCVECGGKAGWIPADALEAFGYDRDAVEESVEPGPRQIYLTVRARWDTPPAVRSDGGTRTRTGDGPARRDPAPAALDDALARWDPDTDTDPATARAQTRRAATLLATTGDRLRRGDLVDALADATALDGRTWWEDAAGPGLARLADTGLVDTDGDGYRWIGRATDADAPEGS